MVSIVILMAGSALCGMAGSALLGGPEGGMAELIGFRALQGLGAGGLIVNVMAIIGDLVPPRERGQYQGIMAAVMSLRRGGGEDGRRRRPDGPGRAGAAGAAGPVRAAAAPATGRAR
ncbi:MFS transporter [Nonomuraea sp. NPDC048916]|uniref:MFS transporter n=1 Tax=Nonomuraea sp. NPDC048916 TaxID=3154232 RepID=UPI00340BEBDA